jgi:RimJ/RimL family protein N-acetyltransferase
MVDDRTGPVTTTARLAVRPLDCADAAFLVALLNQPSWLRFIGDRGVRSVPDAERYIENGPMRTLRQYGYAMNLVQLKEQSVPIGVCGLVKRDWLPEPDLGFALLERFWGHGYGLEAASAVVGHAKTTLGLPRLLAITTADNTRSGRLLGKLGFTYEGLIRASPESEELRLYAAGLRGHDGAGSLSGDP